MHYTSRDCWATTFCIDEMGVTMPPKLQAKASPSSNVFANLENSQQNERVHQSNQTLQQSGLASQT